MSRLLWYASLTEATTPSLEQFGGSWSFEASNPRVISATGSHAGGNVVIQGDRFVFTAGDYRSEGPIEFEGTIEVQCRATTCSFEGLPMYQLHPVDDRLMVVHAATLNPVGSFAGRCGWEDIPEGGVLTVEATDVVDGEQVPTVVRFTFGTAGGLGEECESASHVLAWDVTATRLP